MLNYFTIAIIIILIIMIIVIFQNKSSQKSLSIESYGQFCGRYSYGADYDLATAKRLCRGDNQCTWNDYTAKDGTERGWCGKNPEPPYEGSNYSS